jgi:hypothetical protein
LLLPRSPIRGLYGLPHEIPEELDRIGAERTCNGNKFDDIKAPFATLIFGDEGLRTIEPFCPCLLTHPGGMSHRDKGGNEPSVFRGFRDFCMGRQNQPESSREGGNRTRAVKKAAELR